MHIKKEIEYRETFLNPIQFKTPGLNRIIDLRTLGETNLAVFHRVYYKEIPLVTGDMDGTIIVIYSPKYKAYQQKIRCRQVERAKNMMQSPAKCSRGENPNDPAHFIKKHPLHQIVKSKINLCMN